MAQAISGVSRSVDDTSAVNRDLNSMLERQIAELDQIGDGANGIARAVRAALPEIRSAMSEVTGASEEVLGTADDLAARSTTLVTSIRGYFSDLDHGAIKVGILHSLSGTLTSSERPLQQLLVMMIEELNKAGGLLGRPVEAVIHDPRSRPEAYAEHAREMLADQGVAVIFGCWSSAARTQVLPVLERENGLLFYPSQYEGEEQSPQVFYTGATPRQQAIPAMDFLLARGLRRFALVGTDYIYPRTTNAIIKGYLAAQDIGPHAVEEHYAPAGEKHWRETVQHIQQFAAGGGAAIVSTISGDSNVPFFRELSRRGIRAADLPVMTLSINEAELAALTRQEIEGHFAAWSYLSALENPVNAAFVDSWRRFTGDPDAFTNVSMEATRIGFKLWSAAVAAVGTTKVGPVRAALRGSQIPAPSGFTVRIDPDNQHLHMPAFIGRMTADGHLLPAWKSEGLVPPQPWSPWLTPSSTAGKLPLAHAS
jgi:urea transport system substrate-binding protein